MGIVLVEAITIALLIQQDVRPIETGERSLGRSEDATLQALRKLVSSDGNERNQGVWAVRSDRRRTVRELHRIVVCHAGQFEKQESVNMAIRLLGELREKDAVPMLVDKLDFTCRLPVGVSALPAFPTLPSVAALIDIGLPSLDPLVKRASERDDQVIVERSAIVIDQVLGTDLAVLFVEERRNREKDDIRRRRLNRLIEQIDKTERNKQHKRYIGPLNPPPAIGKPPQ